MRGAWSSQTRETRVRIEEVFDAILSTEINVANGNVHLKMVGALASNKLAYLTQSQDSDNSGILHSRPILIVQADRRAVLGLPKLSGFPRVKLAHGTLVKIPRPGVEVYLLLKDHLPHREDPLPAILSLLHASVSTLEHLMSDLITDRFPLGDPANSLRRAQMNRLTLLRKISEASDSSTWRARLFRFYNSAQPGIIDNFKHRFTQNDLQIHKVAIQVYQRITMGDNFENISNSSIVNRSSDSSITIQDPEALVLAIKKLKEFESSPPLQSQLDDIISEAEAGKPMSKIAQMWRTTSAGLPKIAAMGTIMTAVDRFLGTSA